MGQKKTFFCGVFLMAMWSTPIIASGQIQVMPSNPSITVGKIKNAELYYNMHSSDTVFHLMYHNAKYSTLVDINTISWVSSQGETDIFYKILMSVFTDEHKKDKNYEVALKLGDESLLVTSTRSMGITSACIFTNDGYFYLTEEQVKKLFNKK